ncbi:MAG: hypothetical protein AABM33_10955 [Pseudomonadota bacterium]
MSIRITYKGVEISVSNPMEAAAVARELGENPGAKIGRPLKSEEATAAPLEGGDPIVLAFLSAILKAGAEGATAETMMRVLSVDHPKGLGGRSVRVNNTLHKLRLSPEEVYTNARTPEGRLWKAGPKITEALEAIKRDAQT